MAAQADAILERARAALEPHGWKVWIKTYSAISCLVTEHQLTPPMSFAFDDTSDPAEFVASVLAEPEFRTIEARPRDVPHAPLLKNLRDAAAANGWPPPLLDILARVLSASAVITDEEAAWLAEAGAPWSR